jgi:hypothetical protein
LYSSLELVHYMNVRNLVVATIITLPTNGVYQFIRPALCLRKSLTIILVNKIYIICHKNYTIENIF